MQFPVDKVKVTAEVDLMVVAVVLEVEVMEVEEMVAEALSVEVMQVEEMVAEASVVEAPEGEAKKVVVVTEVKKVVEVLEEVEEAMVEVTELSFH